MKTWAVNRPGKPGGSDFKTDDIGEVRELPEQVVTDARALVTRMVKDEDDRNLLLEALGL